MTSEKIVDLCVCGLGYMYAVCDTKRKMNRLKETSSAKSLCHWVVATQECQSMKKTCFVDVATYLHHVCIFLVWACVYMYS